MFEKEKAILNPNCTGSIAFLCFWRGLHHVILLIQIQSLAFNVANMVKYGRFKQIVVVVHVDEVIYYQPVESRVQEV